MSEKIDIHKGSEYGEGDSFTVQQPPDVRKVTLATADGRLQFVDVAMGEVDARKSEYGEYGFQLEIVDDPQDAVDLLKGKCSECARRVLTRKEKEE